jgi:hypothetical protein
MDVITPRLVGGLAFQMLVFVVDEMGCILDVGLDV